MTSEIVKSIYLELTWFLSFAIYDSLHQKKNIIANGSQIFSCISVHVELAAYELFSVSWNS